MHDFNADDTFKGYHGTGDCHGVLRIHDQAMSGSARIGRFLAAARLTDIAFEKGLILYWRRTRGGLRGDHVMVCPPMIIDAQQVDALLDMLDVSLAELGRELAVA